MSKYEIWEISWEDEECIGEKESLSEAIAYIQNINKCLYVWKAELDNYGAFVAVVGYSEKGGVCIRIEEKQ